MGEQLLSGWPLICFPSCEPDFSVTQICRKFELVLCTRPPGALTGIYELGSLHVNHLSRLQSILGLKGGREREDAHLIPGGVGGR